MRNKCFTYPIIGLIVAFLGINANLFAQECGIIYVAPNGATSGTTGTRDNPADFQYAFGLVNPANNHMRLAHGVYELTEPLEIPSDIVIEGGFEAGTWYKTNADSTILHRDASNYDAVNKALVAVRAINRSNFRFQDVTIKVDDAPANGVSIYGMYIAGCSDYYVSRCIVITGNGSDGIPGQTGQQGLPGANGANGETGEDEGSCCRAGGAGASGSFPGSNAGGNGGNGGEWGGFEVQEVCVPIVNLCQWIITPDSEFTNPGEDGQDGQGSGSGQGGQHGTGLCELTYANSNCAVAPLNNGDDGTDGIEGIDGGPGIQGYASYGGGFYLPGLGETGDPGQTNGAGGGGGGGGGAKGCEPAALQPYFPSTGSSPYNGDTAYNTAGTGGGGGGGGEGGQNGFGGLGGEGGGGVFCIFTYNNGTNGVIQDNRYLPGYGGQGGQGGAGGPGGPGGIGGIGGFIGDNGPNNSCNNGEGGDGGDGGVGGFGGQGGKGSDGARKGLEQIDGTLVLDPNIYNPWEPEVRVEYFGCTNSNVRVETDATGVINWIFGFGAEPQNSTLQVDTVQYSGLLGSRNLTLIVDGVPYFYANYILVEEDFVPPVIDATRTTICVGESTDLTTTFIGDTYQWTIPGGSITSSADQNPGTVSFANAGDYIIELITTSCCGTSKTTDTIHVLDQVVVDLGEDLRACFLGDLPVLDGNGNDGATYAWTLNGFPTGLPQQYLDATITGTYGVQVSYGPNCSGTDEVEVEIYTITPVDLGPDQAICPGNPLPILNAGIDNADYAWTVGGNPIGTNDIELEVNLPGTYGVSVIEEDGCSGEDDVVVLVSEPSVFLGADINVCANEAYPILNALNQGSTYEWFHSGNLIPGETEQTLQTTQGGTYDVVITNIYGCQAMDQLEIDTFPALNAAFSGPASATVGSSVSFQDQTTPPLNISMNNPWTWNFGDGTGLVNQQNPSHAFIAVGVRPVFLIASNGICSDTAYAEVDVNWNCPQIGLTAGFTMNPNPVVLSGAGTVQVTNTSQNAVEYVWDFGDGTATSSEDSLIHAYTSPGTYTITLTAINYNCTTTTTQSIVVLEFGVGINELGLRDQLSVYPNPNTGLFTVELELDSPSEIAVELNNVLGQRVYQTNVESRSYWRKEFDLSSYVKGVYLLRISTDSGVMQRKVIID
ncbi:MAG: PKD domain-containing protein [Flavobacteriales bacterium]|nr:PKD domain-containing protein [Flavobacteriales bacterium]